MNRMTRMVSFRVSDEEYRQLSQTCLTTNARSLSDVARDAVHHWMQSTKPSDDNSITGRIRTLESKVEALASQLENLNGSANRD